MPKLKPAAKNLVVVVTTIFFLLKPYHAESFSVSNPLSIRALNYRGHRLPLRAKTQLENENDDDRLGKEEKEKGGTQDKEKRMELTRRTLITTCSLFSASLIVETQPSNAGLVQFPCKYDLMNTYHLMRAGESMLESQDIISTNPLFLTNRDDALSSTGIEQVEAACIDMIKHDEYPSVVKYSLAAKSIDTANIIATQMQVGRNRLIPEYTFMDPRGLGLWDMQELSTIEKAVWAMDHDEAGKNGDGGKPPATDDSTPNETLSNQAIRLRQLMSVLETQFSGDTILLIFPDGTSPALLMCLMAGIPLNKVHEFNFQPGEIRYDVTFDSIVNSMPNEEKHLAYLASIDHGRAILNEARDNPSQFKDVEKDAIDYFQAMTKTKEKSKNLEKKDEISPSQYLSLFAIGLLGMASKRLSPPVQEDDNEKKESIVNSKEADDSPELKRMEELIATAPFDIPEMKEKEKEDRIAKANAAMAEYLDGGDGGDDWIDHMNDLMHDE
mmetsp:Transcript_9952/g.12541  ORF Transcript_9952/g.12541 Transcript_9952/m.12541 type:complete len:498 (+) Transcript_9952:98-1591(+)